MACGKSVLGAALCLTAFGLRISPGLGLGYLRAAGAIDRGCLEGVADGISDGVISVLLQGIV
jgi:hypothetical protein